MLALDSLVIDLIFEADANLDPETVLEALGGEDIATSRQLLDPDMQDPRWELELTPSMPFRRRGERRLLIVDSSVAPLREDPRESTLSTLDFRPEKERMLAMCEALDVRAARIFGLGVWGSAVICAKSARDLRALCLISWALDPSIDVEGRRRATPLQRPEFEEKLLAYDKRLEELDEKQILADIGPAKLERRGDYLVLDVLDGKGNWDLMNSLEMEMAIAAMDRFSVIPGAPQSAAATAPAARPAAEPETSAKADTAPAAPAPEVPAGPALSFTTLAGNILLLFPRERFDLDVAAAMGKKDWEAVVSRTDPLGGQERDQLFTHGGDFVAPLEFLSEVFVEGTPLSRPVFEELSTMQDDGTRTLEVHCPRFGQVVLIDMTDNKDMSSRTSNDTPNGAATPKPRFISSAVNGGAALQEAIRGHYSS